MTRVNIYLPTDLAEQVQAADINVSGIAQEALVAELGKHALIDWLGRANDLAPVQADTLRAVRPTP